MKLHYERVWDYDIDEQKIIDLTNDIKITHFVGFSNTQLHRFSERIARNCLNAQLAGVDISKLPNALIKPVIDLIYDRFKKRIESAGYLNTLLTK